MTKYTLVSLLGVVLSAAACSQAGVDAVERADREGAARGYDCLDAGEHMECQEICEETTDSFEEYYSCGGVCWSMRCTDSDE